VDSQTILLGNDSEEHILDLVAYQLKPRKGNKLFPHNALYALRVQHPLSLLVLILVFSFDFSSISTSSIFASFFFNFVFRHTRLDHEGQDRVNKLTKDDLLDQFTRAKLPR